MGNYRRNLVLTFAVCVLLTITLACSKDVDKKSIDWPQWRYSADRLPSSPSKLPSKLHLKWVRQFDLPQPAWPKAQTKLQFDLSYDPVVMGRQIFVPSMVDGSVTAYHTETGWEHWKFFTDAPVRFAPIAWNDKVYFVSDDGYLYCLNADDGILLWKFRGGPTNKKVLGNGRLVNENTARGGPVF
ncbi:MAG: PQQ-binding-like beta-propeller repeat protein [Candidatus Poribacteria bacterium]|nr:PQQ-binding-like beta-propeller repeat protein [Candidatus Poribacteria bacterium]